MDPDEALTRAWSLGMDEAGWTDEVMDEAERLLPTLVEAGYADTDERAGTWWFSDEGMRRYEEIEKALPDQPDG